MEKQLKIRPVQDDDIPALLAIYNYYILTTPYTFEEEILSEDEFRARVRTISARFPFFVAEIEQESSGSNKSAHRIAGYAYLDSFNTRSAYRFTADLSLYLDKDFTHCGLGTLLLAEIENAAKPLGIRNIISLVTSSNEPSVRFHKKNGFRLAGELMRVGLKFDDWHSVQYYQKELQFT